MMNTPELYKQILCRFADQVAKKVRQERFGLSPCNGMLSQEEIDDLWCLGDIVLISLTDHSCCDINKLKQNIDYL